MQPTAPASDNRPRAFHRPIGRTPPGTEGRLVILLARTGGRRTIRVRETDRALAGVYGVLPFELFDTTTRKRLDRAVLDALPWEGRGPDPLGATPEPVTARLDPTMAEGVDL